MTLEEKTEVIVQRVSAAYDAFPVPITDKIRDQIAAQEKAHHVKSDELDRVCDMVRLFRTGHVTKNEIGSNPPANPVKALENWCLLFAQSVQHRRIITYRKKAELTKVLEVEHEAEDCRFSDPKIYPNPRVSLMEAYRINHGEQQDEHPSYQRSKTPE